MSAGPPLFTTCGVFGEVATLAFCIAFSTGVSVFDPAEPEPLEVLLSQADTRMYAQKRRRRDEPGG